MSEKRMTRSSSSSIALAATSTTGTNHNHHNHNHYNHDQDSSDSLVLVRESRIRNVSESTMVKKSTATTLNATNRKRKLDSTETETETTNNDLDDLGTGSSPSSSSSSSKKPASSSSANSSSSTTPTTVSSQLRHSNRRLSKNQSNHVSSSNVQEQSSSPVQENSTTNPQRRTTRVETRAATKRQPVTTANSIAAVDANNNADDETEQAYLNSVSSDATTSNLNDKIITRRQSCNRLKSSADGANIDSKDFLNLNRRRIPSHPLGLNQSLKLQQRLQDISVRTAASNIENLIDQSSSSSSLASSSTSNTMLAATTSTTAATTSQTTPKATTSRVKSLSSSNSTNHLKNAFKELSNNTTTTTTTNSTTNKKRSLSTSIQPALGLRSSSKRTTTTTTTIDRPKNGVDESSQLSHADANHEGAIGEDECAMMMKVCCPVQGCASGVSLDGLDESHVSYDKCPLYFGMHGDECRTRRVEYERRMKEMRDKLARINDGKKALRNKKTTQEQCEHYAKLIKELKKQINNSTSTNPVIKQQQQYVLPSLETTPELLGDIKHLSTSFIITSITNSFAPTPMPHLGATFAPPPTSLASHSLLHNHHHHPLSSSHLSQSHQHYSGSGSHQQLANSFPPSYHYDVSAAGSHGQPHHSQSTYSSTHPANVNFLNRLHPTVALPPNIDDLGVSPIELDFFRDVLVTGMNETLPSTTRLGSIKKMREDSKLIQLGNWEIETWYKSPYPDDYWQLDKIFLCQFCLQYMKSHSVLNRHLEKCVWRHPPGREIYRKDSISFFEVDGKFNKIYCQNLCLLAKLFLDHKTLYFDVEPFLFYVLTQYDAQSGSFQMIGYFSKEKQSIMNYNLSCILILPQFMTQGFGRLLIDFSYLLSRVEGKHGSPERPLSDLGLLSYRSYWKSKVLTYLARHIDDLEILVKDVAAETGILTNDIISTLQYIGLVKYWKGKHVILKDLELIEQLQKRKYTSEMDVDASCLRWSPYVYQTIINECESSPPPPLYHQSSSSRTRHSTSGSYD